MALDTSIIVNAMLANIPGTPTAGQVSAISNFAAAVKSFVMGAKITYNGAALVAPSGGGPVTEAVPAVSGLSIT